MIFCSAVKIAHKYREAHVAGNRQQGAHHRRLEAVAKHVADIFKGRKAQGDKHGVDDAVKTVVKGRMFPGGQAQQKIF